MHQCLLMVQFFTTCAKVGSPESGLLILTKPGIIIEGKTNIEIRFHFYTPIPCPLVFFVLRSCYAKDSKNGQSLRYRTLFWIVQKFEIVFGIWFEKGWVTLFMHITIHNMRHVEIMNCWRDTFALKSWNIFQFKSIAASNSRPLILDADLIFRSM